MNMIQSVTSFLTLDPISFNQSLGNRCQTFCSKDPSPNILSRFVIGVIIKDITRISDIALHIIVGLAKITICAIKLLYSILARLWGSTPNYEIGREGLAHLGFSTFYLADIFISPANIINRYPKDLIEKVENVFASFLQFPPLQLALLRCGTGSEKSKILATNYLSKYPEPFRNSLYSITSSDSH